MNTSELWVIFAQAAIQLDKGAVHAGNEADNLIDEYRKRFTSVDELIDDDIDIWAPANGD